MGSGAAAGAGSWSSPTEGETPLCRRKWAGRTPGALRKKSLYPYKKLMRGTCPTPSTRGQQLGSWGPTGT